MRVLMIYCQSKQVSGHRKRRKSYCNANSRRITAQCGPHCRIIRCCLRHNRETAVAFSLPACWLLLSYLPPGLRDLHRKLPVALHLSRLQESTHSSQGFTTTIEAFLPI